VFNFSWEGILIQFMKICTVFKNDICKSVTSRIETVVFNNLASVMLRFVVVLEHDKIDLVR